MNPQALLLLLATLPATAFSSTLVWDYTDDPRVERFTVQRDAEDVHTVSDPSARSLKTDPEWFTGGAEYTLRACSPTACSDRSNAIYVPQPPTGVRLEFTWEAAQ